MKMDTGKLIAASIERHKEGIKKINTGIWTHPEPAWHEVVAHDLVCDYFESLGSDYKVTRHAYNIETSFLIEATHNPAGKFTHRKLQVPTIVFNAEYDALPFVLVEGSDPPEHKPGHACGHNLICTASVAAFIAAWEALKAWHIPGTVKLLGTPAEEGGGGKIRLLKAGAYIGVDACLMAHPGPLASDPNICAIAFTRTTAAQRIIAEFSGVAAHAGMAPWKGKNALDALISAYVSIAALRQQLHPTMRVAGIITDGGKATNIIPDHARAEYSIRAAKKKDLDDLRQKVTQCFEAGATAIGCTVKVDDKRAAYWDILSNEVLCRQFTTWMNQFGVRTVYSLPELSDDPGAASDQGNVSYFVPSMQAAFCIDSKGAVNHTAGFAKASGTDDAFNRALGVAKGLAGAGFDVLSSKSILREVKESYDKDVSQKAEIQAQDYQVQAPTQASIAMMLDSSMPLLRPAYEAGEVSLQKALGALMATDVVPLSSLNV